MGIPEVRFTIQDPPPAPPPEKAYAGLGRFKVEALEEAGDGPVTELFFQDGSLIILACGCTARVCQGPFCWRVSRGGFPGRCRGLIVGEYAAPVEILSEAVDRAVDDLLRDHPTR